MTRRRPEHPVLGHPLATSSIHLGHSSGSLAPHRVVGVSARAEYTR